MRDYRSHSLPEEIGEDQPEAVRREQAHVWALLGDIDLAVPSVIPDDLAWKELERRTVRGLLDVKGRSARPPIRRHRRLIIAAVGAVTCMMVGVVLWLSTSLVTIDTRSGEVAHAMLPDGSAVTLNSGSSISYRRAWNWPLVGVAERTVRLRGEALFDVRADEHRTFVVETFNSRVEVSGTRFNVRAWGSTFDDATSVALLSGAVRVIGRSGIEGRILDRPGATTEVRGAGAPEKIRTMDIEHAAAWVERGFVMIDRSFGAILEELSRRFDVRLEAAPGVDLHARMSLFYSRDAGIESILHDICLTRDLVFRKTSRGYVIER